MESIHELLRARFSPRAFDGRSVSTETLRSLLEAARWAPSSYNEQPWRFIIATEDDRVEYDKLLACLSPRNQEWAKTAPVLMLSAAKLTLTRNDKPNRFAYHDVGLAVSQMLTQATVLGLQAHQMGGFDATKARETYGIPAGYDPVAAIALGYSAEDLPASRTRKTQEEITFAGTWGKAY